MTHRWRRYWPHVVIIVTVAALFAPFLSGQQVLYWGTPLLQFYPWRQFALEVIRSGHLPLWNPNLGMGAPLIANYQSAVFYPPNWIALIVPLDYSFGLLAAAHLAWAGLGMVNLARSLGLRPFAQTVAGLAFGLSQGLVGRAGFLTMTAAVAWTPWVIWAGERVLLSMSEAEGLETSRLGPVLRLSLVCAFQFLAGHAQITWYTLLLLAAWNIWRVLLQHRVTGVWQAGVRLSTVVGALLLAGGLAALQLLPTAEYLGQSSRAASADYEFVATYSYSPWRLLTLIAPDLLGNPARGQFYGYGNYWEDAAYLGALPLLLALGAILHALRRPTPLRSLTFFLGAVGAISVALALGRNAPLFPLVYRFVPTFDLFQAPARMLIWFSFSAALLAGLGAETWQPPHGRALYWTRLGAAGAVAAVLVGGTAFLSLPVRTGLGAQLHTVAGAVALAGVTLFGAGVLALTHVAATWSRAGRLWQGTVVTFVAVDLIFASFGLNPGAPADLYRTASTAGRRLAAALAGHRLFQYPSDEYSVKYEQLFDFRSFNPPGAGRAARAAQVPNTPLLDGLASANNFDPLVPARYAVVLAALDQSRTARLWPLMDVAWIASSSPLAGDLIEGDGATNYYRAPGEPRRVWTVYAARTVADADSALAAVLDPSFDPGLKVILEAGDAGVTARRPLVEPSPDSPNIASFSVSLERNGWVVVADSYYPGWYAYLDGQPARLYHGDFAFRALPAAAGDHALVLVYQPRSFQVGLGLTLLSALICLRLALPLLTRRP